MISGRRWLFVAGLASAWLPARPAGAHQGSMTYLDAAVADDRSRIDLRLRMDVRDTAEPLDLPPEPTPADDHIVAHGADLLDYVLERIEVDTGDVDCATSRHPVSILVQKGSRFAQLEWTVTCPRPVDVLAIDYDLFFDLDPQHTCNLVVRHRGEPAIAPLQMDTPRFEWDLRGAPPGAFLPFVRSGIGHIVGGFDHLAFLLGLLLVAGIALDPDRRSRPLPPAAGRPAWGAGANLRIRPVASAIRYTALIATSFTVAHSITLAIAALGWMTLPSRLVESLVAVSIVWVAVDNLVRPEPGRRWLLTFGFGLIHGLAFASVLDKQLPPSDVAIPLLSFNLGVELGQLAVILLVVPVLHLLAARALGAGRYRATVVSFGSAVIALLGVVWFIERAFALEILGL